METEMQRMEAQLPMPKWSSGSSIDGDPKYTSLRDVLAALGSPTRAGGGGGGGSGWAHDFDPSSISIRNQLVKHAASAYLQSAVTLAVRDRGCLQRLWRRALQRRAAAGASWRGCVRGPLDACVGLVMGSMGRAVARMAARIGGAWRAWRAPIA